MKKIVITGATSMIGIALINEALQDLSLQKIYAVVRPNTKKKDRIPSDTRIIIVPCDNASYRKLASMISDCCDIFYHLAWPRTATYNEDYDDILLKSRSIQNVIEAMHAATELRCKKFVGAGSQSEYGIDFNGSLSPETPCHPIRADGIIHLAAGQLAGVLSQKLGMSCVWMRIFSIYGKNDRTNSLINSTITKLQNGEHCMFTLSEQKWDFLAAEDAGRAFYLVGEKSEGNHIYCLGSGVAKPLRRYIEIIRDIVSPKAELGFGEIPYPANPVMNLCADITALQNDVGWFPTIEFEKGIQMICERHNDEKRGENVGKD